MLLGWGLRGFIGGGPFGALIPGCYVALCLCLFLNYRMENAAIAALFGAIGVGYGGDMTYGQTLGFIREPSTVYWGLFACLVKGGIWGLLGGTVLGIGLTLRQYQRKTVVTAFLIGIAAFFIGMWLINEPKWPGLYFSNREDRPRDESWAGLLATAIAILVYLRGRGSEVLGDMPLRFARWGLIGGGLGFGLGALWFVIGPKLPVPQQYFGWWKMMEFTFGFLFGAALGYCAYLNREALFDAGQQDEPAGRSWGPFFMFLGLVALAFVVPPLLYSVLPEGMRRGDGTGVWLLRHVMAIPFSYMFFGSLAIVVAMRSVTAAWQVAVTLTFFHTVWDYVRDLSEPEKFGYVWPFGVQLLVLLASSAVVGFLVYRFQSGERPVSRLLLLAVWSCYLVGCVRSFALAKLWAPPEGESAWSMLMADHPAIIQVHGIFTVSAIIATWFICTQFEEPTDSDAQSGGAQA
jgi:hypothetical protein